MSTDLTPAVKPDPATRPYPDLTAVPESFYQDTEAKYEAMAAADRAAFDEWEIAARGRVFPQPGRHAKPAVMVTAPDQGRAVTVPDPLPVPQFRPAAVPELPKRRPSVFARHLRRGQAAPEGRSGTIPPPAARVDDEPTLLPGAIPPVPAEDDPAAAAVQAASNEALKRAGAKPADLESLARPGDGRDATTEMTAVLERPADPGESK